MMYTSIRFRDLSERSAQTAGDRKSTRLNSSHGYISYAVFCLKKKKHVHIFKALLDACCRISEDHAQLSLESLCLDPALCIHYTNPRQMLFHYFCCTISVVAIP